MSIYCTIFDIGFEHSLRCARLTHLGLKLYGQDDAKPCTCGRLPVKYQGSHVLHVVELRDALTQWIEATELSQDGATHG